MYQDMMDTIGFVTGYDPEVGQAMKKELEKAREIAEFSGFSQSMTYSFESPKVFDRLRIPEDSRLRMTVNILNPLGEDFSIMRTRGLTFPNWNGRKCADVAGNCR